MSPWGVVGDGDQMREHCVEEACLIKCGWSRARGPGYVGLNSARARAPLSLSFLFENG